MRAVVSKRGVDDGNQKGGGFPQPAQESHIYYNSENKKYKSFPKKFSKKYFPRKRIILDKVRAFDSDCIPG
jgi:hypothetical protein